MGRQTEVKEEDPPFNALVGDVDKSVREVIEAHMQTLTAYNAPKAKAMSEEIPSACVEKISCFAKGFKIIASCSIMPKREGLALQQNDACLWDAESDGHCLVRWENKAVVCIVRVYGIGIA